MVNTSVTFFKSTLSITFVAEFYGPDIQYLIIIF